MSTLAASLVNTKQQQDPVLKVYCQPAFSILSLLFADLIALSLPALISRSLLPARLWSIGELVAPIAILTVFLIYDLYPGLDLHSVSEIRRVFAATAIVLTAGLWITLRSYNGFREILIVVLWAIGMLLTLITRSLVRSFCRHRKWWGQPVFILGKASSAERVIDRLRKHPELGLRPVAFFCEGDGTAAVAGGIPVFEGLDSLDELARRHDVRCAVITHPEAFEDSMLEMVEAMAPSVQRVLFVSNLSCPSSLETRTADLSRILALEVRRNLVLRSARLQKRIFDLAVTIPLLLLAAPVTALIVLLIKMESSGSALYGQIRVGRDGKHFKIWKLRSMVTTGDKVLRQHLSDNPQAAEEWRLTQKLRCDPRITKLGAILRRTSLDELPQVWNIICGEMSLVGPRPVVPAEALRYGVFFRHYRNVSPGLTGLWQVSGRNDTTYTERVELDTFYVRNWSVWLDLYILARTFGAVVKKNGAY